MSTTKSTSAKGGKGKALADALLSKAKKGSKPKQAQPQPHLNEVPAIPLSQAVEAATLTFPPGTPTATQLSMLEQQSGAVLPNPYDPNLLPLARVPADVPRLENLPDPTTMLGDLVGLSAEDFYLGQQIKLLEARREKIKGDIAGRLMMANARAIVVGRFKVGISYGTASESFSKDLALAQGWSAEQIQSCMQKGDPPKPSVRVYDLIPQPKSQQGGE